MVERASFLRRAGYSTLLIDFQATGETKGDRITFGWKESRDVLAAVEFIRKCSHRITSRSLEVHSVARQPCSPRHR